MDTYCELKNRFICELNDPKYIWLVLHGVFDIDQCLGLKGPSGFRFALFFKLKESEFKSVSCKIAHQIGSTVRNSDALYINYKCIKKYVTDCAGLCTIRF